MNSFKDIHKVLGVGLGLLVIETLIGVLLWKWVGPILITSALSGCALRLATAALVGFVAGIGAGFLIARRFRRGWQEIMAQTMALQALLDEEQAP